MPYSRLIALIVPVILFACSISFAQVVTTQRTVTIGPDGAPVVLTTRPTTGPAPATKPTVPTSPEAQKMLDDVRDAYAKLNSLAVAGTLGFESDIAGQQSTEKAEFTASFLAPNRFRHQMKSDKGDDLLLGSTGTKVFAFIKARNSYMQAEAPQGRAAINKLPGMIGQLLSNQDTSLALAVSKDASFELLEHAKSAEKGADMKIGEQAYPTLLITSKEAGNSKVSVAIDPKTHLVRRIEVDLKGMAEKDGAPDVKLAKMTMDYTTVTPDAPAKDEQFAWAPPEDARDIAQGPTQEEAPAVGLAGQAAPDFTLKDFDGKDVKLSDLKGSVVVLDFWATWCPPCRASLPSLDKVAKEYADKGVKVYAVNVGEDKDKAQGFMKQQKLGLNVLLDTDSAVGARYKAQAIPETVVIDKDGIVKKVLVGFDGSDEGLKAAIDGAIK